MQLSVSFILYDWYVLILVIARSSLIALACQYVLNVGWFVERAHQNRGSWTFQAYCG